MAGVTKTRVKSGVAAGWRLACVYQQELDEALVVIGGEPPVGVALALPAIEPGEHVYSRGHVKLQDDVVVPVLFAIHLTRFGAPDSVHCSVGMQIGCTCAAPA